MIKNTDQEVYQIIKETSEGKFKGGNHAFGLKEGGVGYVYDDKNKALIGDEIHKKVEDIKAKIISGEIKVSATPKE
jgi:basic membrane protein A